MHRAYMLKEASQECSINHKLPVNKKPGKVSGLDP